MHTSRTLPSTRSDLSASRREIYPLIEGFDRDQRERVSGNELFSGLCGHLGEASGVCTRQIPRPLTRQGRRLHKQSRGVSYVHHGRYTCLCILHACAVTKIRRRARVLPCGRNARIRYNVELVHAATEQHTRGSLK